MLALLAFLPREPWFYAGLGIPPMLLPVAFARPGIALELFLLALPVFTFVLEPLSALYSRRHEFEADAFADAPRVGRGARRARWSSCTRTTPRR